MVQWSDCVRDGFFGTVGKTPLIRLNRLSEETGCDILAKAEFLNPGTHGMLPHARALLLAWHARPSDVPRTELAREGFCVLCLHLLDTLRATSPR